MRELRVADAEMGQSCYSLEFMVLKGDLELMVWDCGVTVFGK